MKAVALAILCAASPAAAGGAAEVGLSAGYALPGQGRDVMLADHGYDVAHLVLGVRVAGTVAPVRWLELGAAFRHWQIDEATAPDGATLRSRGDGAAAVIGFRLPMTGNASLAMTFDVGRLDIATTLRGAGTTERAWFFAGRDQVLFGDLFVALDIGAAFSDVPLSNLAFQVGYRRRLE